MTNWPPEPRDIITHLTTLFTQLKFHTHKFISTLSTKGTEAKGKKLHEVKRSSTEKQQ